MLKATLRRSTLAVKGRLSRVVRILLKDEAASGKFLLGATLIALFFMNSPWQGTYEALWSQVFNVSLGQWGIAETLRHWINEGLMAIFFLVVGLEIKREITHGELHAPKVASLPIVAAIAGMIVPALLYLSLNAGRDSAHGWGVPMTTDIAFALGVLALLGRRIPGNLRLLLLTIAVVDDIGAIVVIAIFYAEAIHLLPLLIGIGLLGCIALLQWLRVLNFSLFVGLGILLWLAFHASGIHATIAGALLGLIAPIASRRRARKAIADRLERALIPVSAFVVVPLFALANAGVAFKPETFGSHESFLIGGGIILGLTIGKLAGILGASWLLVRVHWARLPSGVNWPLLTGGALLAGIGFTLSIFVSGLAFENHAYLDTAKISVFIASLISATVGLVYLRIVARHPQ